MIGQEVFLAITGISLTLVGFSSLIITLRRPREEAWEQREINGLVFLGVMSLGALIFSLLPFPLHLMGITEPYLWNIPIVILVLFAIGSGFALTLVGRRHGFPSRRRRIFISTAILSGCIVALMILTVLGVTFFQPAGVYLLAVIWLVVLSSIQFLVFLTFAGKV